MNIVVVLMLGVVRTGFAQDRKTYEERKARLEREIAIIDKQLADNAVTS